MSAPLKPGATVSEPADHPAEHPAGHPADARHLIGSFIGMIGMACVLFVILASGLVAPLWAVLLGALVWLMFFVVGARWFMTHPWRVATLPVMLVVAWVGAVTAGAAYLDWNA
jgi:hypothetical protein